LRTGSETVMDSRQSTSIVSPFLDVGP
jgi:hypothetical protein